MLTRRACCILLLVLAGSLEAAAQEPWLILERTVPLPPTVRGRIRDLHLHVDQNERVPVTILYAAIRSADAVAAIDLSEDLPQPAMLSVARPQCVRVTPVTEELVVSSQLGQLLFYERQTLKELADIDVGYGAADVSVGSRGDTVWVACDDGLIGVEREDKRVARRIELPATPVAFVGDGQKIYAALSDGRVVVIGPEPGKISATWWLSGADDCAVLAVDRSAGRLFVGSTSPPRVEVLDLLSGRSVDTVPIGGQVGSLIWDSRGEKLIAVCGEGMLDIITKVDAEHYELSGSIPTRAGTTSGIWHAPGRKLYVALPSGGGRSAEIRVYGTAAIPDPAELPAAGPAS